MVNHLKWFPLSSAVNGVAIAYLTTTFAYTFHEFEFIVIALSPKQVRVPLWTDRVVDTDDRPATCTSVNISDVDQSIQPLTQAAEVLAGVCNNPERTGGAVVDHTLHLISVFD